MVSIVLLLTPFQCGTVQIRDVPEHPTQQKVFFYEPNQPFYFPFGKRVPWLTKLRAEACGFHEGLVVLLPDRIAVEIPVEDNTFHVVRQHILGNAHIGKAVEHPNKEAFLLGIGKELNVTLSTVMAHHGKAGNIVF